MVVQILLLKTKIVQPTLKNASNIHFIELFSTFTFLLDEIYISLHQFENGSFRKSNANNTHLYPS